MKTTFPQLLLQHATQRPQSPALREKEYGIWQTHTWADLAQLVEKVAAGLHQAGLQRHEHMVVIGANRPRLYATMLCPQVRRPFSCVPPCAAAITPARFSIARARSSTSQCACPVT